MVSVNFLQVLNSVAKEVLRSKKPFGGIQLIFSGDFLQLPPVDIGKTPLFKSKLWGELVDETVYLSKIYRQQQDSEFAELLNELR